MASNDGLAILQQWAKDGVLKEVELSSDGSTLSLKDATTDASKVYELSFQGKSCKYTLASLFLQVLDPNQGLLPYRNSCKAHNVTDPVKVLDKPIVVGHVLGVAAGAAEPPPQAEPQQPPVAPKTPVASSSSSKKKHRRHKSSSDKKKRHRSSDDDPAAARAKKKSKGPMTDEQLFSNLNVVADKRLADEGTSTLRAALSTEGFVITREMLQDFARESEQIAEKEIPVGNSASILRSSDNRDFSQVLDLYLQTIKSTGGSSSKSKSPKTPQSTPMNKKRSHLMGKTPIIVVPKGMTFPITLVNAHEFFAKSKFVPRDVQIKKGQTFPATFARKVASRHGGGVMEYELMDNPKSKLGKDPVEWARVVAVVALGASWQFKDWIKGYDTAVSLFSNTFGFYVGMEGDPVPSELQGWNVKHGRLHRDKRGLDSVTYASFWNGLEEWMSVHKREMLPQSDT